MQTNLEHGLDAQEVQELRIKYGYNEIPEKKIGFLKKFGKKFWGIVPWMLEITAIITCILGKYLDTIIIAFLLLFNATMSLWREKKATKAMASLKQKLRIQSRVKRENKWTVIPARELVPGDVVRVRSGDILPADIKVIDGSLGVDQSMITGESILVEKSIGDITYAGSAIKRGESTGIVDATGIKTYFGKTISLLKLAKPKLHMEEVTVKVTRRLALIVLISLLVVFIYALLTGFSLTTILPLAGVLLVAAIPIALPTMFTLNMALGSGVLAKQGVLVTRLDASEDAATMDVLCVDKTGTVTMNKLFIEEEVPTNGFSKTDVLLYGALASKEANDDPIDIAFLIAAEEAHLSLDQYTQIEFAPFDPKNRMTEATIQKENQTFFVRKGSLHAISSSCNLPDTEIEGLHKLAEDLSNNGLRVIAVAYGLDPMRLTFIGMAGIADRIREDSRETLEKIRDLGIPVKMLTGDSLLIAKNIAQQIGLGNKIIKLPSIEDEQTQANTLDSILENNDGFVEIYPEDKYKVVKALQEHRHVVGMTGDGVNDAPALGQAEVGIAVKNATDIAKDSASIVLIEEGLGGIISMIKVARTIYQRIHNWALMMVARKLLIMMYVVAMLFLSHYFMISLAGTVLMLFLGDFGAMALSSDNVKVSSKPDEFNVSRLFIIGGTIGILMTVEGIVLTLFGLSYFNLGGKVDEIYTFGFTYVLFAGILALVNIRERNHFWKSRPSKFLGIVVVAEFSIVIIIGIFGFVELAPLGVVPVFVILGYTLVTLFLINDPIKVYLMHKFSTQ